MTFKDMENCRYILKEIKEVRQIIKELENYLEEMPFLKKEKEIMYKISKLKKILTSRLKNLLEMAIEIEDFIASVDDIKEGQYLRLRCFKNQSYEEMAEEMGVCTKTLFRYRSNIISKLESK